MFVCVGEKGGRTPRCVACLQTHPTQFFVLLYPRLFSCWQKNRTRVRICAWSQLRGTAKQSPSRHEACVFVFRCVYVRPVLSIWGNRAWLLTQRWVVKCACVCVRSIYVSPCQCVCASGSLQCWSCGYWWERWRLLSMSHSIRQHLHVCLCEGEAVSASHCTFTHTPAQMQPASAAGTQTLTLQELQPKSARCDWHRGPWKRGPQTADESGVFTSFQTRWGSSSITSSTAVQRRCRHRRRSWRHTSRSWRPRLDVIVTKVSRTASVTMRASLQNFTIPVSFYKGIRNLLESYHIPELIKVQILVDLTEILFFSPVCLI